MKNASQSAADLLKEIFKIGNISQVIAVGKDGFVIESLGGRSKVNDEELGSTLATAVNEMEKMSSMMNVGSLDNITVTFEKACAIGIATPDAIVAAVAQDNSSLGLLRIKLNALVPRLKDFL